MTLEDGLRVLYPDTDGVFDLTTLGYVDAMRRLRAEDPLLSERVQRVVSPALDKALPRRSRHWTETSAGTKARFELLSKNPYLANDVRIVRSALGIPDDHVKIRENDEFWRCLSKGAKPGFERRQVEQILVGAWLRIHEESVTGVAEAWPELPERFRASAISTASVDLGGAGTPSWLEPDSTKPKSGSNITSPMLFAARRLAERHGVPSLTLAVSGYIITGNSDFVGGIDWKEVSVRRNGSARIDKEALEITVSGIDEYWSKDDWESIWQRIIRPHQDQLRKMRGQGPMGRRMDAIARLEKSLPALHDMVDNSISASAAAQAAEDSVTVRKSSRQIESDLADLRLLLAPLGPGRNTSDFQ